MTTAVKLSPTDLAHYEDLDKCSKSFLYFLWPSVFGGPEDEGKQFVCILDPQQQGKVPFEPWPHLVAFAQSLTEDRLTVLVKSRQEGASWLVAAHRLWGAMFHGSSFYPLFSLGEREARALLHKSHIIWGYLPSYLQLSLKTDNTEEMVFATSGGTITAHPSTTRAGRSETATRVGYDEHDFHEWAAESMMAVKPTIDAGGGMDCVSTVDKRKIATTFKGIVRAAMVGEDGQECWEPPIEGFKAANGWRLFFWPYDLRPGRDEEWYKRKKQEIASDPSLATLGLTPELYMEQEYPRSLREALSPSKAASAFDHDGLDAMQSDIRKPVRVINGVIEIYQEYSIGEQSVAFTDTSHGVGLDSAATGVLDVRTGAVVAQILNNRLTPDELAYHSVEMLHLYKDPLWGIEDNDWGIVTIRTAQRLGYTNFFYREWQKAGHRTDHTIDKLTIGWHTGNSKSHPDRMILWGDLISAVSARRIAIPSQAGLLQFYDVIRDERGYIGAVDGGHDDYPLAVGGCLQMRKYMRRERKLETISANPFA